MVNITLLNKTGEPYAKVRDMICEHLVGNRGYIENDIIVSDCLQDDNKICFSLGSDRTPCVELEGELTCCNLYT